MTEPEKNCYCDIFSACELHYIAKPLEKVTYDSVQVEVLRWELIQWKKKHSDLSKVIKKLEKDVDQLSIDVTTWQARFLAMASKFDGLKKVTKELDLWFSTTKEQDEKFE